MSKDDILKFIFKKAGIQRGQMLPWWGIALLLIVHPSRIPMFIGLPFYDWSTDCIKIKDVKLPLNNLADIFCKPSPEGHWFRVSGKTEYGTPIIEHRIFEVSK